MICQLLLAQRGALDAVFGFSGADLGCVAFASSLGRWRNPVIVAANIFPHVAVFEDDRARDDVVKKLPIVAHQEHRAIELDKSLFQELKRFRIQVVGRLVEHDDVGRLQKHSRKEQPVSFAAREQPHEPIAPDRA